MRRTARVPGGEPLHAEPVVRSPLLDSFPGVSHAFSTRKGGESPPPFDSLNLSAKWGDSEENVRRNVRTFLGFLDIAGDPLFLNQVHGCRILAVDDSTPEDRRGDYDGAVVSTPGVPLVIRTADCLPILLYDPVKKAAGAVHAGWRGTALSIAEKTAALMCRRYGSRPGDIIAAMGPAIGPCCYEVGEEVEEAFGRRESGFPFPWKNILFRLPEQGARKHFDLAAANRLQLLRAGLRDDNISLPAACTCCEGENFYSYRRDGEASGRQGALVMLNA